MENVYVMKSTARYSGVYLSEREMEILKYILEFSVFPAGNIHRLFNAGIENPRSKYAVSMRLGKLVKSGILVQLKTDFPKQGENRPPTYAYRIGSRGFDLLVQENLISSKEAERRKKYGPQLNMPTAHNKTVNTIFTELVELLIERGESFESLQCQYFRGDRHKDFTYANSQTGYSPVIPDWIYETKDQIVCLELDTGRQTTKIIESKFARYKLVAQYLDKPLTVVFSVGLSTAVHNDSPKEKRIGSLKNLFSDHTEWPNKFEVFVLPSHRTCSFLYKMMKRSPASKKVFTRAGSDKWIKESTSLSLPRTSFDFCRDDILHRLMFRDQNDFDLPGEITRAGKITYVGLLHMEEGSVRSYQRARANTYRIQHWNSLWAEEKSEVSLVLIYKKQISVSSDVLPLSPHCRILISNTEELSEAAQSRNPTYPSLLEILTQYTRKLTKFI